MNRELLSKALCEIDESFIAEAYRPVPEAASSSSERIVPMKKKRIITFALAAVLILYQIEEFAKAHGIALEAGWKVRLATTVKKEVLKGTDKVICETDPEFSRIIELFSKL